MKRSKSSKSWLKEHFNDPYVKAAQAKGYRARSAFKLLEIQHKDHFIKPSMNVVDLGAAPGSWSQIAREFTHKKGHVFALDILSMDPLEGVDFIQGDFREEPVLTQLLKKVGTHQIDVVLSDMSPNMSGHKAVDIPRAMYLAELALDFAKQVLKPKGTLLVKVFQGEGIDQYIKEMRAHFQTVKTRKPKSSRSRSKEIYLLGLEFKAPC